MMGLTWPSGARRGPIWAVRYWWRRRHPSRYPHLDSVADFGARGNMKHNDGPALKATFLACRSAYFPAGHYSLGVPLEGDET